MHKSRLQILQEARALVKVKPNVKPSFKKLSKSVVEKGLEEIGNKTGLRSWLRIGHGEGHMRDRKEHEEIEAMKQRVFGRRTTGTSDLLFYHRDHGIITHPATGNITHYEIMDNPPHLRKGSTVDKKIAAKVRDGGREAILGTGRIEHHEGGGGIISFASDDYPNPRIIRTISRAYPKHTITDGFGNVIEQKEENMSISRKHIKEVIHRLMEAKRSKGQKGLQPWSTPSPYEVRSDSPVGSVKKGASHEEQTSAANIRSWQGHIDRLSSEIMRHERMKPGWKDRSGNVSQQDIDRHLAELRKFHKHFTQKQEIAVANHNAGNFEANNDHYTLTDPVGQGL
jgi:hypothetical protein